MNNINGYTIVSLLAGLVLTVQLTFILAKLYKRKVEKMINAENDFTAAEPAPVTAKNPAPYPGVRIENAGLKNTSYGKGRWTGISAYFIPGAVVCLVNFYVIYYHVQELKPVMAFYLLFTSLFPLVFVLHLVAGRRINGVRKLVLIYFALLGSLLVYFVARNSISEVAVLFSYTFIWPMWPALVFLVLQHTPGIKTLAPFVFPVVFAGTLLILMWYSLMAANTKMLAPFFNPVYRLFAYFHIAGWSITGFHFFVLLLLFLLISSGLILLRTAWLFKVVNGEILLADCFWITLQVNIFSEPYHDLRALIYPLLLFGGYKILQVLVMKLPGKPSPGRLPRQLLVLRVFSLGKKSEQLFNYVSAAWLPQGPIKLIAGFDLTNTVVDIDDILIYLSGRIRKRFCLNSALIKTNIGKIDKAPDIDGRYRVNELYCNNSTWKEVLNQLLPKTDLVLMDLRAFAVQHKGCAHEIQQIIYTTPVEKVIFICDPVGAAPNSDMCKLMKAAWEEIPVTSPNYGCVNSQFVIYSYQSKKDLQGLLARLANS